MGLGQYNSLGEYCGPHTASSVFLILIPLTDVTSKWPFLFAICSLQGVASSSWKIRTALAMCVISRPCNGLFAGVYLQWFTCDANLDSMGIFLTSLHMRYHMKAHEISGLLVKTL